MLFYITILNFFGLVFLCFLDYKFVLVSSVDLETVQSILSNEYNIFLVVIPFFIYLLFKLYMFYSLDFKWSLIGLKEIFNYSFFYKVVMISGIILDIFVFSGLGLLFFKILFFELGLYNSNLIKVGFISFGSKNFYLLKLLSLDVKIEYIKSCITYWNETHLYHLKELNLSDLTLTKYEILQIAKNNIFLFDCKVLVVEKLNNLLDSHMNSSLVSSYFYSFFSFVGNNIFSLGGFVVITALGLVALKNIGGYNSYKDIIVTEVASKKEIDRVNANISSSNTKLREGFLEIQNHLRLLKEDNLKLNKNIKSNNDVVDKHNAITKKVSHEIKQLENSIKKIEQNQDYLKNSIDMNIIKDIENCNTILKLFNKEKESAFARILFFFYSNTSSYNRLKQNEQEFLDKYSDSTKSKEFNDFIDSLNNN